MHFYNRNRMKCFLECRSTSNVLLGARRLALMKRGVCLAAL
jgi:hypothetical protein